MRHVYIHVPFCARRCVYCDFAIAVRREIPAREFLAAVLEEHARWIADGSWDDAALETLYLGGGTPSLLPAPTLARLVAHFAGLNSDTRDVEITIEANPDDVSNDAARAWVRAGINRVSLGAQSFDDRLLEWMHRTHRARDVAQAVTTLRNAGIQSLSLDLIFARPDGIGHDFQQDLERALRIDPDHLSAYGLTPESHTALAHQVRRHDVIPCAPSRYADEFLHAHERLAGAGYDHYEISNYAKPGQRSRHNSAYWSGRVYAGLGPSAHSLVGKVRRWNVRHWAAYQLALQNGREVVEGRESLSEEQILLERLYLGLRTSAGVRADLASVNREVVEQGVSEGWLDRTAQEMRLTPEGWLRLDELCVALTTSAEGG